VKPGARLRFGGEGDTTSEAYLWVYRRTDVDADGRSPVAETPLDPGDPAWVVELPPGRYVLVLFRAWEGVGDVSHVFALDVAAPGSS
jgi:hypothetical protein